MQEATLVEPTDQVENTPFQPKGLGLRIFQERYARFPEETWEQACRRLADHVAEAETNGNITRYSDRFFGEILSNRFMPGGRIWYGAGRPKAQLLNCVEGDTLIHTAEGLIRAEDLEGREVPVLTEDGTYRLSQWACYGEQQLYRVLLKNGDELFATAQHEWVVSAPKGGRERITTENLAGRSIPLQHVATFNYDEEEYLEGIRHGLTFGDGAIISFRTSVELRQFGDSRELLSRYFDVVKKTRYRDDNEGMWRVTNLPLTYKQFLGGDESPSYTRGFLAGWIAADGCVDTRGHVMLHHRSRDTLVEARRYAASVGIPTTSIKMTREFNPWTGEEAPVYKLTFVKAAMYDERMILKQAHRDKLFASPVPRKQATMKVESVTPTDRIEKVYCCVEPETHTMVIGPGYLTGQCFVLPTADSREGWGKTIHDVIVVSGLGGGVGVNCSPVRGRGSEIKGTGGKATGAVSLMQMIDRVGDVLVSGGGRRLALMLDLDIDHPDIEEFLEVKLDLNELNNANISVVLNMETGEFQRMVREDAEIPLRFKGLDTGKSVRARDIWQKIVQNAWQSGEPGVLNGWLANQQNNIHYHKPLVSTNPCGEIWLEEYGCCDLGALVLPQFVKDGQMDWDQLDETIRLAVRFLDNVLTVNYYPLPEIAQNCQDVRRIGLGVMGLHSMLLALGLRYSSEEGLDFIDHLFSVIKHTAYDASVNLAIEKGPFPAYHPDFLQSGFMKKMKRGIRNKIREHGIRNCALLTIAPTGTTAMVAGVSSGIEPLMAPVYWRHHKSVDDNMRTILNKTLVVTPEFELYGDLCDGAADLSPKDHFEVQRICQSHIDNAVSKTINLPNDYPVDELADLWLDYLPYVKGSTFYRWGSRSFEPIAPVPTESVAEAFSEALEQGHSIEYEGREDDDMLSCPGGVCTV